jgi:YjbE family integral membrane protein
MTEDFLLLMEIVLINIVLSGDNAVVIAMASKNLPQRLRTKAIWWGSAGAVALRLMLTAAAALILELPWIQGAGAIMLLYIAIKLCGSGQHHGNIRAANSLHGVVRSIVAADFVMSLDNVLAIAAVTKGNAAALFFGVALSLPLIVWGSRFIVLLMDRFPVLVYAGAALLGFAAGEMLVAEPKIGEWFSHVDASFFWVVPWFCAAAAVTAGWWSAKNAGS